MCSIKAFFTYSKQSYMFNVLKRYNSSASYSLKHIQIIQNITESPEEEVVKYLRNNLQLQLIPEDEIVDKLNKLKELEMADKKLLDRMILMKHHPKTIRNRYLICKELGIKPDRISSIILSKYLTYIKMKVSHLKKKKLLEQNSDVVQNLLECVPLDPSQIYHSSFPEPDSLTADEIKTYILRKFLIHVVGYSEPFKEEAVILKRLRHKSLGETLRNLSVLQDQVGIPLEKIRNNPFLLSAADADNTLEIMSRFPSIAGVNIKTILFNHPKILASSVNTLIKIYQYLNEAGITDEALSKCFEVFTLNCETVRTRLDECQKHKFLSVCRHHPRVLELIIYQKKAKKRLDQLEEKSVKLISLSILASSDKNFNKYFERGSEKYHGMDSVYFLAEELGTARELLRSKLQKHPYWIYVSLLTISNNLQGLRSRGFSSQEIIDEICLLLYPTEQMLEEVDKVVSRQETIACRDEKGLLKRNCILPLALYFIERENNFNSYVWARDNNLEERIIYPRRLPDFDQLSDRSSLSSASSTAS